MPCVCGNGRIIRCAEGNRVSRNVQKTILHMVFIGIVYELIEAFTGGLHVHACQSHSIPRLIAEKPFVDPPAVDGRQAIDDVSTDCEFRITGQFRETNRGYGMLFHRPAAADAEIISAVHAAADRDLAVRIEGQGSMLPVHTFQQYRAFTLRQETGIHRLMHNLAVGIDVECEGRVAKSERHHADLGEMYRHAVGPMPDLPFKGYGKLLLRVEDVDGNSNAIAQLCTACVPCDNLESFCRMTVRDHRDVVERWDFVLIVVHQLQFDGV